MKNLFARFARVSPKFVALLSVVVVSDGPLPEQLALGCLVRPLPPKANLNLGRAPNDRLASFHAGDEDFERDALAVDRVYARQNATRVYNLHHLELVLSWSAAVYAIGQVALDSEFSVAAYAKRCRKGAPTLIMLFAGALA